MDTSSLPNTSALVELWLFFEDICCDLCQFEYVVEKGQPPESLHIHREFYLGAHGTFADIRVAAEGEAPYFIEVKHGYSQNDLVRHLHRKYGVDRPSVREASKIVLVVDTEACEDWPQVEAKLREGLIEGLALEVWDEAKLRELLRRRFDVDVAGLTEEGLEQIRDGVERAKGFYAFGGESRSDYELDALESELLWHLGAVRVRRLREAGRPAPRDILPPGRYPDVPILIADLSSFSSYVRDTRDSAIIRECLTSFYTQGRYQIVHGGGMLYQFMGDAVIAFFGLPDGQQRAVEDSLLTAKALLDIANSITNHWQRRIDRLQPSSGAHIGLTLGDLDLLPLRPFSRTRIGAVSDAINMAARLLSAAGPNEIAVSNSFYHMLGEEAQEEFTEMSPLDARNVGRIKAWKLSLQERYGEEE